MNNLTIEPFTGISKKTNKEFHCFKLTIGDWSTLIFPRSQFEYNYIKDILESIK